MESILLFLEKYSNVLIAFFAFLTTIATFLIWRVARRQAEISSKQTEYMYLMGKAAEQPIIQTNYTTDNLQNYTARRNFNAVHDAVHVDIDNILVIEISNIGRGSAYNLRIEQRGRETTEIDILPVGQKYEYFVSGEDIRLAEISPTVKVTYQDIFENEFTVED
ncbi:MAG: hypothetical protein OXU27_18455 [Candidatus Poribacteria bacterium]|nr:hypothetical protein [Candidatus Poribacteria bacterium]